MFNKLVVKPGAAVDLSAVDPAHTGRWKKKQAEKASEKNCQAIDRLQYLLYAENRRALLVVLQGMDTAGKDGTIRHVLGHVNPQGVRVTAFKVPSAEEAAHDFLWRIHRAAPERGQIMIFNRSHYEDVLVTRVLGLVPRSEWSARYDQINTFEAHLAAAGVTILKFFLHISKDEQLKRLNERLDDPAKRWKVGEADFDMRRHWARFQQAYEDALSRCSTAQAPWYIIPANHKWFRNLAVSQVIRDTLEGLSLKIPLVSRLPQWAKGKNRGSA